MEAVCSYCARKTTKFERHHLAGWANARDLLTPACLLCHRELNLRLEDAGVILEHRAPRDEHDRGWALMVGASELVVAVSDEDDEPACAVQRLKLAAGRALHEANGHPAGPNPITASRRDERRRRERHPRPTPVRSPTTEPVALSQRLEAAGRAWTIGLGGALPLPDDCAGLLDRLERYPRLEELRQIPTMLARMIEAAVLAPMSAADVDELERLLRAWLELLSAIAAAEADEEAFSLADSAFEELAS